MESWWPRGGLQYTEAQERGPGKHRGLRQTSWGSCAQELCLPHQGAPWGQHPCFPHLTSGSLVWG